MSGPNSNPEVGQQNYRTPSEFLKGCLRRFGYKQFFFDLACSSHDCVGCAGFEYPELDALKQDWTFLRDVTPDNAVNWLNPPFAQSKYFARKCAESGARIIALVPVAIGTNWWRQWVHQKAVVVGVGRLVFNDPDGNPVLDKNGKPSSINRDCAVLAYNVLPAGTPYYLLEDWRNW